MVACTTRLRTFLVCGAVLSLWGFAASTLLAAPAEVLLSDNGQAKMEIVVAAEATERVQRAAETLAKYLTRITSAPFRVVVGAEKQGLAVGQVADFPGFKTAVSWDTTDATRREDYWLRSHAEGLYLIGTTDLAVEHAVWDLLFRLGYRQFFPATAWEVVPQSPTVRIAVDTQQHPDYYARRIWYGFGAAAWAKAGYAEWCAKNRATSGIELRSGHAYDGMLSRNKAEFAQHPEYLGLVKDVRKSTKFCISNPALRQLLVADAIGQLDRQPEMDGVSVDPSDGGGWCECAACRELGSVSDRAVTLANAVAEAVEKKYPDKFVGMYAYNEHSPPPNIRVHPRVVVSVATAFIREGFTVDQLMSGWQRQGATVGVREYYSVHTWDRDLPGKSRGANLRYLQQAIPHHHELGARFLSAESSDNWACNGLGYYLASRMLWDVKEAQRLDELKADFFDKAFGSARQPLEQFYTLTDAASRPLLSDDLVGRLYRLLREARARSQDAGVLARLADLTGYVRYLELWLDYSNATGVDRQRNFETLARFAYRIRHSSMIHTVGLVRDVPARDKSVFVLKSVAPSVKEDKNPWISNEPFSADDISQLIEEGIARRQLFNFEAVAFSEKLVPAAKLKLDEMPLGTFGIYSRGERTYHTWISTNPTTLAFQATGGLVYGSRGPASLLLYPDAEAEGKAVGEATIQPDKQERSVSLTTTFTGLHRLTVSDRGAGTRIDWPAGTPMTISSSPEQPAALHGRWTLYFYVPKGTKIVGGFANGPGTLVEPSGRTAYKFSGNPEYFSVPVSPDTAGKLWRFDRCAGPRFLMTVPPYLARNASELLLPAEVVERDSQP